MTKTRLDKTEDLRINERKAKIIDYVAMGWSYQRIGREVGVSGMQVCRDVKEITEEWKEHYIATIDEIKMREARRIEHLLAAHWAEFEISKYRTIPAKIDTKTGKPVKGPAGKDRQVRVVGDREYLKGIQECVLMLWKIYGIGQDTSTTNNNTLNVFNVDKLTETLRAVAVEQENSRLAEVERLQQAQAEIENRTVSPDKSLFENLEARRNQDKYDREQAEGKSKLEQLEEKLGQDKNGQSQNHVED